MMPCTQSIGTLLVAFLDSVQERANNPRPKAAVEPHFVDLTPIRLEFQPGDVVVLTVNSMEEKVLLSIHMAVNTKEHSNLPTLLFSAASSTTELATILVGAVGRINLANLRSGNLEDQEWPRLTEAIEGMRHLPLHVYCGADLTMQALLSLTASLSRKLGRLGGLIIDASCLEQWARTNRQLELGSSINRTSLLKALAIRGKCPVILLTHLAPESDGDDKDQWWIEDLAAANGLNHGAAISSQIYRGSLVPKTGTKKAGRSVKG